jgi:protein TonB
MVPALGITLALFVLMMAILQRDDAIITEPKQPLRADFLMPQRRIETHRQIIRPKKTEVSAEPRIELPKFSLATNELQTEMPRVVVPRLQAEVKIDLTMPQASGDVDYMPLLKVAPIYPPRVAQRRLEGYVIVEYTLTRSGGVRDVRVIEAKPAHVFDQAAIEAARKFKYRPRKVDGEFVEVPGVRNRFTFRLEQ